MKLIKENWGIKLISLVLALVLWLIVVNVSKPEISDFRTVDLDIKNESIFEAESKSWEMDRSTVSVNYTVRTDQRANITAKDFHAYIDLKDYSITGAVPVYVEVLNDKDSIISNVTTRPSVIRISIEDVQEKQFDLKVRQNGNPADGFVIGNTIISPETVYVTGPESSIGRISEIGITVESANLTGNKSGKAEPVFYDANGNVITNLNDVKISSSEINYSITLHKKKSINLLSSIRGIPAAGYQYESMTVSPDSIQLSGPMAVMDAMTVFELPPMDITGATSSMTESFRISDYLPAGVELAEPSGEINITVRIEKIPETISTAPATMATSLGASESEKPEEPVLSSQTDSETRGGDGRTESTEESSPKEPGQLDGEHRNE